MSRITSPAPQSVLNKVPEVTVLFWIIKVLTTGVGETTSDYLAHTLGPIPAVALAGIGLTVALALQYSARRYLPWLYWLVVLMVSVFGTMAADVLHVGLGVPYVVSATVFVIALVATFAAWYAVEGSLSIHSIHTRRRETFYWCAILATFALGTAVGDLTAITLHLGYFASGVLFVVLIAVPTVAYFGLGMSEVVAFWLAYIVTRPLGASFADWAGVPAGRGGLGLGTGLVSLALTTVIAVLVGYLASRKGRDAGSPIVEPPS